MDKGVNLCQYMNIIAKNVKRVLNVWSLIPMNQRPVQPAAVKRLSG
jgi:hypothetical protein